MGDDRHVDPADLRQGPGHELLRDADAEAPADQLVPDEPLGPIHRGPGFEDHRFLSRFLREPERQEPVLDPITQREVARPIGDGQEQGDGLGHIADGVVRLLKQPVGDRRRLGRPGPEFFGRNHLLRLPPDQEIDGPRRVGGGGPGEVTGQGLDLLGRSGGLVEAGVEFGEVFHDFIVNLDQRSGKSNATLGVEEASQQPISAETRTKLLRGRDEAL